MAWSPIGQLAAAPGTDGATIRNGALTVGQDPPAGVGRIGDYFLDTTSGILWGPKTGADWSTAVQVPLQGSPGALGTPGTAGAQGPAGPQGPPYNQVFIGPDSAPPDPADYQLWVDTTPNAVPPNPASALQVFTGNFPGVLANVARNISIDAGNNVVVPNNVAVLLSVTFSYSNSAQGGNIVLQDGPPGASTDLIVLPGYGSHDHEWICLTQVCRFTNGAHLRTDHPDMRLDFITVNCTVLGP